MTVKSMARIAAFTALTGAVTVAFPSIPLSALNISVTLQTLAVMLAGVLLKPAEAFLSMLLYIALGVIGLPVFSNLQSGPAVLIGPTSGFIIAFPFSACLISLFRGKGSFFRLLVLNLIFGVAFIYLAGAVTLSLQLKTPYFRALSGMALFLLPDGAKAALSAWLGSRIGKHIKLLG